MRFRFHKQAMLHRLMALRQARLAHPEWGPLLTQYCPPNSPAAGGLTTPSVSHAPECPAGAVPKPLLPAGAPSNTAPTQSPPPTPPSSSPPPLDTASLEAAGDVAALLRKLRPFAPFGALPAPLLRFLASGYFPPALIIALAAPPTRASPARRRCANPSMTHFPSGRYIADDIGAHAQLDWWWMHRQAPTPQQQPPASSGSGAVPPAAEVAAAAAAAAAGVASQSELPLLVGRAEEQALLREHLRFISPDPAHWVAASALSLSPCDASGEPVRRSVPTAPPAAPSTLSPAPASAEAVPTTASTEGEETSRRRRSPTPSSEPRDTGTAGTGTVGAAGSVVTPEETTSTQPTLTGDMPATGNRGRRRRRRRSGRASRTTPMPPSPAPAAPSCPEANSTGPDASGSGVLGGGEEGGDGDGDEGDEEAASGTRSATENGDEACGDGGEGDGPSDNDDGDDEDSEDAAGADEDDAASDGAPPPQRNFLNLPFLLFAHYFRALALAIAPAMTAVLARWGGSGAGPVTTPTNSPSGIERPAAASVMLDSEQHVASDTAAAATATSAPGNELLAEVRFCLWLGDALGLLSYDMRAPSSGAPLLFDRIITTPALATTCGLSSAHPLSRYFS